MRLSEIREFWDKNTPTAKVLAGLLVAVLVGLTEYRLFLKPKLDANKKLGSSLSAFSSSADAAKMKLENLRKANAALKLELKNLDGQVAPSEGTGTAALSAIDILAERCGLVIVSRREKRDTALAFNKQLRGNRGNRERVADPARASVHTYALEGCFAGVHRFFSVAASLRVPFSIKRVKLSRDERGGSSVLLAEFDVEIPEIDEHGKL